MHMAVSPEVATSKLQKPGPVSTPQMGPALFLLFVVLGLIAVILDRPPRPLPEQAPSSVFSAERALKHLSVIAREPHPINSPEHNAVRDYITGTLRGMGLVPEVQKTTDVNEREDIAGALENIVCRLSGSSHDKAVLMAAHYDSVAAGPGASDDGVAVAAFLETIRALKSLPQLKRDVIFLFTDGEERGLLGAQAFVEEHPWAHDVGLVFNFEARGTSGPSIMFETSDNNGWLITNFAEAASHPVANSLSYEIYKRLPNNTDFTVFRHAGYSGLNFAFIDNLAFYHTKFDTVDNVDRGSFQHQGDYILEIVKHFGNITSEAPRTANLVYFDVLGWFLVRYGQVMANCLLACACILVAISWYVGVHKTHLRFGASLLGLVCMLLGVIIALLVAEAASWAASVLKQHSPRITAGMKYHSHWYVLAFSAFALSAALGFYSLVTKKIGSANLVAGVFLSWAVLAMLISVYFPGGSYLFVWPLLFSAAGQVAIWASPPMAPSRANLLLALSGVPAIGIVIPMVHKIFFAFAAQSTLIVSLLLVLVLSLLIGPIIHGAPRRWLLPPLVGAAGVVLLIIAIALPVSI